VATILFDGVAYGMLLFVLACGLAVTLGLQAVATGVNSQMSNIGTQISGS